MKSILWLLISISVSVHAHQTDDEGQNRRSNSLHLDCFDTFIPLINRLANEAKEMSGGCVANADEHKERELYAINRTRSELFSEVKRIKETLSSCSAQNDHMGYFDCLKGIIEIDRKIVGDITMRSSKYSNKMKEIEEQKIQCFRNSIYRVKDKSSTAIHSLQYCLTSGDTPAASGRYNTPPPTTPPTSTTPTTSTTTASPFKLFEWNN